MTLIETAAKIAELLNITPDTMTDEDAALCLSLAMQYQGRI